MLQSVAHSFLDSVDRQRSSNAVISSAGTWSYEDIGGLAGAVSAYLESLNVRRGERIGLLIPNSAEFIATFYGIHMAGCVVVALNLQEPAQVLARLLKHCGATVLFLDSAHRDNELLTGLLEDSSLRIVNVEINQSLVAPELASDWAKIYQARSADYRSHVVNTRSSDLAAILYTSGTTGSPKGVMLSHGNLFANTKSVLEYLPINWVDRAFNVLPFYYSYGNSILHTHMTAGACLILQNHIAFPHAVLKFLSAQRATSFYGVPTTYALLFDSDRVHGSDLSSLRYVAQAGGPMPAIQQLQLVEDLPGVDVFVMYGQTEATARLSYLSPDRLLEKAGSVGKEISGVRLRVGRLGDETHSADDPAEVYASGDNIMMGYWNDTQATNEVLRDGWLRTGDLGYFDHDGFLFLTGRSSDMIKTGANRVSPAEIEDVVARFQGIKDVGAYAINDKVLGQAIAVAIVSDGIQDLSIQELQRKCLDSLAHYKVPKYVRLVSALPRTSSGKLKRHVLAKEHEESESSE